MLHNSKPRRARSSSVVAALAVLAPIVVSASAMAQADAGGRMARPDLNERGPDPKTPLPTDDRLVMGELDNGLDYIIREHSNPPGQVGVWLHIGSGSMNETDEQRGLAHYLEHMAFNGSDNFPPGEVVKFFESIGLTFGRDQNAFTGFDQTAYQLYLPDTERETLAKGLLFFADVADRLLLNEEDIEEERGIIFEELRTGRGPAQRMRDQWLERLAPGSLIGVRLPIGTEETLAAVQKPNFVDYYNKWYVASNMTVIVVGDMDPAMAEEEIRAAFGGLEAVPDPENADAGVEPYTERRAIVAHDPEVTQPQVGLMFVDEVAEPATDVGGLRRDIIWRLATEAFNRRLAGKVDEGKARILGGGAFAQNLFGAMRFGQVSAATESGKWREGLEDLTVEVRRAELHGFSEQEMEIARESLLASLEQIAEQEATLPARVILSQMAQLIAAGETHTSPQQVLELTRKVMPYIRTGEVNAAFADIFDTSAMTFLVQLPTGGGVPEESALLAMGAEWAERMPEPDAEDELAESLLDEIPEPGTIARETEHEASGVTTAVLGNGVVVHHREMDQRQNFVEVRITMLGGQIEETAENRGITQAAGQAWARPATSTLSGKQIRQLLAGTKVQTTSAVQDDFVQLSLTGTPEDIETGMQLVYRLLTDPRLETIPFEQWRTGMVQGLEAARKDPLRSLQIVMADTMYPESEARARSVTPEQIGRLSMKDAQAWLNRMIRTAPVEVAIVGDLERGPAFDLARTYLGSIAERDEMTPRGLSDLSPIAPPTTDRVATVEVETQTPAAGVIAGFMGPDSSDLRETRIMQLASRTLSTRLIEKVREEERLVYSISAQVIPAEAYPGYGLMMAGSATDPAKADVLADRVGEIFAEFAETGPTEEELETAKKQIAKTLDEAFEEPGFWSVQLAQLDKRGRDLDDLMDALEMYNGFTADEVRATFAAYQQKPKVRVIVKPASE